MDKNLENKLDEIMKTIKVGFDSVDKKIEGVEKKIESVDKKLEDYIDFSSDRMTKIEDSVERSKKEILSEIQTTKLDSLDRYSDKETVSDHENRITKIEEKVF